jgi:hypothetical protein
MEKEHRMATSDREMANMCAMHEKMISAKTPEERQALMAEHMKSMPPEMMQRHMEMMQSQSPMMCGHGGNRAPGK